MKRKIFNKSIRKPILLGILATYALSVLIFLPWSLEFINKTALKQVQEKVELALNSAQSPRHSGMQWDDLSTGRLIIKHTKR